MTILHIVTNSSKDLAGQTLLGGRGRAYSFYVASSGALFSPFFFYVNLPLPTGMMPIDTLALIG